jgi:hypothetical protein
MIFPTSDIIFFELEGIDIKCSMISSILKEILQFYNNEKSHDFHEDSPGIITKKSFLS